jgi:hypothetical protein
MVYEAKMSFEPKIGNTYFLYQQKDEKWVVSMVAPTEWGRRGIPFESFIAEIRLLSDHTWEVVES